MNIFKIIFFICILNININIKVKYLFFLENIFFYPTHHLEGNLCQWKQYFSIEVASTAKKAWHSRPVKVLFPWLLNTSGFQIPTGAGQHKSCVLPSQTDPPIITNLTPPPQPSHAIFHRNNNVRYSIVINKVRWELWSFSNSNKDKNISWVL